MTARIIKYIGFITVSAVLCVSALYSQTPPDQQESADSSLYYLNAYYTHLSDINGKFDLLRKVDNDLTYQFIIQQVKTNYTTYFYNQPIRVPYYALTDTVPALTDVHIDHAWILQSLLNIQDSNKNYRTQTINRLQNRLDLEMRSIDELLRNPMEYDPTDYRPFLRNILNRSEYQPKNPVQDKNILAEALEWIFNKLWELLKDLFKPVSPPSSVPEVAPPLELPLIGQGLIYLIYGIGAVLLIIVIWKLIQFYRNRNKEPDVKENKSFELILEPGEPVEPDEHFLLAETAARSNNFRKAVRHLLLSAILYLDKKDWVQFENFKTNQEYLEQVLQTELPFRLPLHRSLSGLMAVFDRSWYGLQPAGPKDYELCLQRYRECMNCKEELSVETI
jgi:hypothetical protein